MPDPAPTLVAVALNPAIDRTLRVPHLQLGGHLVGRLVAVQPAGKAVNVARLLGSLGRPCVLTGFVGEGDGSRFERSFVGSPVTVSLLEVAGRTRENITLVDPDRGVETHIRDAGFPVTPAHVARLTDRLAALARPGVTVVFSGSMPPGMLAEMFAALLAFCRDKGARVAVDSSGHGLDAVRSTAGLWLVKPNRDELAELTGRTVASDADLLAAAASLRERVGTLLVSLGADGAILFHPAGAWRAHPHAEPAAVLKTVGSGDALVAGYLHADAAGRDPADCLRLAVACGTAATRQLSAGQLSREDVDVCMSRVELTQVG
jgi:1-phosphofructokinase